MNSCKKGVTFDAMETIERNSNNIDKLTSLVSKMNMKMDKHETQYKPQVYQGRNKKPKTYTGKTVIRLEIDHTVGIEIDHIEEEEIILETIDQIIEVDYEITIDMMIEETTTDMMIGKLATDKMTDVTIIGKNIEEIITETTIGQVMEETIIENRDIGLEVKVGKILEIITGIIQGKDLNEVEIEAEIGVEKDKCNQDQEHYQRIEVIDQDQNLDLDQIQG